MNLFSTFETIKGNVKFQLIESWSIDDKSNDFDIQMIFDVTAVCKLIYRL